MSSQVGSEGLLPDAILLDGHPDCLDMLTRLKANPLTQAILVVGLVARDRLTEQLQAEQAGGTAVVVKPFDPIALIHTISAIVEAVETPS